MGWIVVILLIGYGVFYNIREADKKEKRDAEDEAIRRRNEELKNQTIKDWNGGVCPDCNVEWVLDFHSYKGWESEAHRCHCPQCNKKLYGVPKSVNYSEKWEAYFANPTQKKEMERQKEIETMRQQAKQRRNKMF